MRLVYLFRSMIQTDTAHGSLCLVSVDRAMKSWRDFDLNSRIARCVGVTFSKHCRVQFLPLPAHDPSLLLQSAPLAALSSPPALSSRPRNAAATRPITTQTRRSYDELPVRLTSSLYLVCIFSLSLSLADL